MQIMAACAEVAARGMIGAARGPRRRTGLTVAAVKEGNALGPIERFFAGIAATLAATANPGAAVSPEQPPAAEIAAVAPTGPVPIPRPRPANSTDLRLTVANADTPAEPPAPPVPAPNPRGGEAIAALPPAGFTPISTAEAADACRLQLAGLAIDGVMQAPIQDGACGIAAPLEIHTVGLGQFAVALEPAALVDCSVAGALTRWLEEDVQPAAHSMLGQWVTGIRVAGSYACRGRNNDPTAQLSEHAFGNAIDVSAFRLQDGTWVDVQPFADDTEPAAQFLTAIRADACGPFTTVLGPGVDLHDDHFHLDLAARGAQGQTLYCP